MKKNFIAIAFLAAASIAASSCSKTTDAIQPQDDKAVLLSNELSRGENEGDPIVFSQVVQLEGSQEVPTPSAPAVATETKGIAILRVSESKMLYSKVIIQKLAQGDVLRFSHVHAGAAGTNGPISFNLADSPADFGVNKQLQLTDAQFTLITTGAAYVNVHSNFRPAGIIRGQIR